LFKSMLRKNLSKKLAIVWLLASFFIAQGPLQAMVVCIEENGSIEVEAANNGLCASDSGKTSKEIDSLSHQAEDDNCCGPCVDIPFSIGSPTHNQVVFSGMAKQVDVSKSVDHIPSRPVSDRSPPKEPYLSYTHHKDSVIASLRTIILII
jgi:hypothetical protein